jgi:uncharacterized membrane protein YdfJ with MMPL/SSD domain
VGGIPGRPDLAALARSARPSEVTGPRRPTTACSWSSGSGKNSGPADLPTTQSYALSRVGESITFSAATVIASLLTLLLAVFGLYSSLGAPLAIAIALMLLAGLTLTPALLAIFGRVFALVVTRLPGGGVYTSVLASLAIGILMDAFLVRTLLVPSTVALLGRCKWWPSSHGKPAEATAELEPAPTACR